jgi:hypothetical protein
VFKTIEDSGLRAIFAGLRFPAPVWLLVAQAHSWGADVECADRLNGLPTKDYQRIDDVPHALGKQPGAGRPAGRTMDHTLVAH